MQKKKASSKLKVYSVKEQAKKLNKLSKMISYDKMREEKAKQIVSKIKFE